MVKRGSSSRPPLVGDVDGADAVVEREVAAMRAQAGEVVLPKTFEDFIVEEEYCALTTATPAQRAIARALEGRGVSNMRPRPPKRIFGGEYPKRMDHPPEEFFLIAAVRGAKSLFAAALGIWASQKVDVSGLRPGEIPRYSITSLEKDNAKVVHSHLLAMLQKPALSALRIALDARTKRRWGGWQELISDTGSDLIGSEFLWHPSGIACEIRIVAGKRAGGSLVSRWSLGATFDEAPRMVGASQGVVNFDDGRRAISSRLLPGAQVFAIGSPWAPYGPVYEIVQKDFGDPNPSRVVVRANGADLNPFWWTEERQEKLKRRDPIAYVTDFLAEFTDAEDTMYASKHISAAARKKPRIIPPQKGHEYAAAMDPATRGNSWTLVVCDRVGKEKRVVFYRQWQGSSTDPLSPRAVLEEVAADLKEYGLTWCYTDQWAADANRDLAAEYGLALIIENWNRDSLWQAFTNFGIELADGRVELPPDEGFLRDFRLIKRRATPTGSAVYLPKTADGRHCDWAPSTVKALSKWLDDVQDAVPPKGTKAYADYEDELRAEQELEEQRMAMKRDWAMGPSPEEFH